MTAADQAAALARLEVSAHYCPFNSTCDVAYRGLQADLIGAGIATPDLLAPAQPGRKRRTADGTHYRRSPVDKQGRQAVRFFSLPVGVAEAMPGVTRSWRSAVWPLLELTDEQCQAFGAERDREADAA